MKNAFRLTIASFGLATFNLSIVVVGAQSYTNDYGVWSYTTTNGTATITGYSGSGGVVTIPDTIKDLPVTSVGNTAFMSCSSLTSVTIPDSVTDIEDGFWFGVAGSHYGAFLSCTSLTNLVIGNSVTNIGSVAFLGCTSLTSITIPNSVTSVGFLAFDYCTSLTNVIIGSSVTTIGNDAFSLCSSLVSIYFKGNAPTWDLSVFSDDNNATVYYLPGTSGWSTNFAGLSTALWVLPYPVILTATPNFGIQTNGFGFTISWATNIPVVVEGSTTLANPVWSPISTNTLTSGSSYFSDPEWTNYPNRFYRIRSP